MFLALILKILPSLIMEWVDVVAVWKRVVDETVGGYEWHCCWASPGAITHNHQRLYALYTTRHLTFLAFNHDCDAPRVVNKNGDPAC